ncbi:MAG: hypothetical protein AB7I38_18075 [Dehalococcoidia bacterium]
MAGIVLTGVMVTGCSGIPLIGSPGGDESQPVSALGCPIRPAGTAAEVATADGVCTGQQMMARACGVTPAQVDQLVAQAAAGDLDLVYRYGHGGTVYATLQQPVNGGDILISCADSARPHRVVGPDLYEQLGQPGDVADLPGWLSGSR